MLTIDNIQNTKRKECSFLGNKWLLYGVDVTKLEYKFMFIPMDDGRYDLQKTQLVILDRNKKRKGSKVLGYRLWTTDGKHTYIEAKDIPLWTRLVEIVYKNKMICLQ